MKTLFLCALALGAVPKDWYAEAVPAAIAADTTAKQEPPRVQCVVLCLPGCGPCEVLKRNIRAELVPLGWKVNEEPRADVRLVDVSRNVELGERLHPRAFPTCVVLRDGKEVWRRVGAVSLGELTAVINRERQLPKK